MQVALDKIKIENMFCWNVTYAFIFILLITFDLPRNDNKTNMIEVHQNHFKCIRLIYIAYNMMRKWLNNKQPYAILKRMLFKLNNVYYRDYINECAQHLCLAG